MIYKYYPPTNYSFDALQKGYFYFSKVSKLNDPFDASFKLVREFRAFLERTEYKDNQVEAEILMGQYGSCSFSYLSNNKNLWALYASDYKGFCVAFDEDQFDCRTEISWKDHVPYITKQTNINALKSPFYWMIKGSVDYADELMDLNESDNVAYREGNMEEYVESTIENCLHDEKMMDRLFIRLCFTKEAEAWSSEKEFRLLIGNYKNAMAAIFPDSIITEERGYKVSFPLDSVKKIIVGHNFEKEKIPELVSIITKYPNQPCFITNPSSPWKIDFIEIDKDNLINNYDSIENFSILSFAKK